MARGKYLSLEEARRQKKLVKQLCDEQPSEADRRALSVEALSNCDIRTITETEIDPRRAGLDKLMN